MEPLPLESRFLNTQAFLNYCHLISQRSFVVERTFDIDRLDEDFRDQFRKRRWGPMLRRRDGIRFNTSLVNEFYANLSAASSHATSLPIRGVLVPFCPAAINMCLNIPSVVGDTYEDLLQDAHYRGQCLEDLRMATDLEQFWLGDTFDAPFHLLSSDWSPEWILRAQFVQNRILSQRISSRLFDKELDLLYAFQYDLPIDIGELLYTRILSTQDPAITTLPCPYLIESLCLDARVPVYASDLRTYPTPSKKLPDLTEHDE